MPADHRGPGGCGVELSPGFPHVRNHALEDAGGRFAGSAGMPSFKLPCCARQLYGAFAAMVQFLKVDLQHRFDPLPGFDRKKSNRLSAEYL